MDERPVRDFPGRLLLLRGFVAALDEQDRRAFLRGAADLSGLAGQACRVAMVLVDASRGRTSGPDPHLPERSER
jgi:hypothetical protein